MPAVRRIPRLALIVAAAGVLCGCPSLSQRAEAPPSLDRAAALDSSGDHAGAARMYEALAAQNQGAARNDYLLRAAHAYLAAQRPDDAARVLAQTAAPMTAGQENERALVSADAALERAQYQEAARQLALVHAPAAGQQSAYYSELRARLAAAYAAPAGAGAAAALPRPVPGRGPARIALLLPITGRTGAAAVSVRDGFMTAFYQVPATERIPVSIYDTGTMSVAEAIGSATQQGADFIVGPLTREEVVAAAETPGRRAPLLALNFLPPDHPPPPQFYQYALSPEDEARLAAQRVLEDHHRRGVAIVPAGDWGTRVLAAFTQVLTAGGGDLVGSVTVEPGRTDFSGPIVEVLRISDSTARERRLEAVLGTKLVSEPRRRGDIEFIFVPAQANLERLLRPQLRFHFAGDIATYATSDAFEPDPRANEDLEGLMFPDMPWMLGGELADAVRSAARDAWPSGGPHRGRLFAFGFDAYRLGVALRAPGVTNQVSIDGLTGRLSLDAEHRVHRELGWAQLHDGELRVLAPVAQSSQ
jgi:outer membrane PBP1 activator LpoA protein